MSPAIRLATEAGPLVLFFIANRMEGIMVGTAVLMVATLVAIAVAYRLERKVPVMPLVGCAFVVLFGGLTLIFDDELFIKIKPTVVNLLFAGVLFVGLAMRQLFLKVLMGTVLSLTDRGWYLLTWRWAGFFVVLALLNEIVWRSMSTDAWVNFKVFGLMPLSLAFGLAQLPLLMRHQIAEPGAADAAPVTESAAEPVAEDAPRPAAAKSPGE